MLFENSGVKPDLDSLLYQAIHVSRHYIAEVLPNSKLCPVSDYVLALLSLF
jgi:hypothetical protein